MHQTNEAGTHTLNLLKNVFDDDQHICLATVEEIPPVLGDAEVGSALLYYCVCVFVCVYVCVCLCTGA